MSPKGREPLGVLACKCLSRMVISVNNKLLLALHTVSSTARGYVTGTFLNSLVDSAS